MNSPLKQCVFNKNKNNKCQFKFAELKQYNEVYYCEFHLPAEAKMNEAITRKDKNVEVHGKEFNDKIFEIIDETPYQELINLRGVVFPYHIDFDNKNFTGKIDFSHAIFCANVSFQDTTFEVDADFSYVTFIKAPTFYKTQFWDVLFIGAKFSLGVDFRGATFEHNADFMGSIFINATFFSHATFKSDAIFSVENRAYHPNLSIINVGKVAPEAEKFDAIFFDHVEFRGKVDFVNRRFSSTTNFYKTVFNKAPMFHGCKLHQHTIFDDARFLDLSADAAREYRTLNLAMAANRARKDEAKFYGYEQRCIRNDSNVSKWLKLLSCCYDKLSEYGWSVGRPVVALIINLIIFFLIYSYMASSTLNIKYGFDLELIGNSLNFSFQQLVRPFSIWLHSGTGIANDLFGKDIGWIRFTASIQALFNIVFLSLFLISLRWRFKRD